jgi:hypothetical protein
MNSFMASFPFPRATCAVSFALRAEQGRCHRRHLARRLRWRRASRVPDDGRAVEMTRSLLSVVRASREQRAGK